MKNRASGLLKQIITVITTMAKAKSMGLKSKMRAIKNRLIIFSLLQNKKVLMSSISDKLRSLVGHHEDHNKVREEEEEDDDDDQSKAVVSYNSLSHESIPNPTHTKLLEEEEQAYCYDDDKYPDLSHLLLDSGDLDGGGSVIDLVKKSKVEGEEFRLEDEIDEVADLFIQRFHRQMRIQKQLSFKRHMEEMHAC